MSEHTTKIRVRYKDTDQMGFVYYANYLVWFEEARTDHFRSKGLVYRDLEQQDNVYLPVTESFCKYRAPVRYDDLIDVITRVKEVGRSRMVFEYEVMRAGQLMTTGYTKHAFIDKSGRPVPVPEKVKKVFVD